MKPLKVLMINRPKDWWKGGDTVQMEATAYALRKLGVEVDISETPLISPALKMLQYDIIHTFNFPLTWSKYAIWAGASWKKKKADLGRGKMGVVASMIYHDTDKFVTFPEQQVMADNCDACIFLAEGELGRAKKHITIDEKKIHFIPNGIHPFWFSEVKGKKQEDFILTVGRLDGAKGQFELAMACRELKIPLICVGEVTDKDYGELCEEAGAILAGKMEPKDLIKLYAGCKVFALASKAEVMPLVVMEVGAQAKPVVLSERSEYKFKNVIWCQTDAKSVKKALLQALKQPSNEALRDEVKVMTWDSVGERILEIYKQIL